MTERSTWVIYGRIAGLRMPFKEMKIGEFHVGPLPHGSRALERAGFASIQSDAQVYCAFRPADMTITSDCYFWLSVKAISHDAAIEHVHNVDLPLLQTALSVRQQNRQPYRLQVLWSENGQKRRSAHSYCGGWLWENVSELQPTEAARVATDIALLRRDEISSRAASHITKAIFREDTAATTYDREAALFEYFKVIECMTKCVPSPKSEKLDKDRAEIIAKLHSDLASVSGKRAAGIVHAASDTLNRLNQKFLNLRIAALAKSLDLNEEWQVAALRLCRLRNRLGHPSSEISPEEWAPWLNPKSDLSAFELCRVLLAAYFDVRQKECATGTAK